MIKNRQALKAIGTVLFIFLLCVIFIEPLRTRMNNIFIIRDRGELKEEELVGTVIGYNPRIKEAQGVLKDAGFYFGSADGFMGTQTRRAIMNFQRKKGLQATGKINQLTLLA
ncbi:MAG: peptidoglycan-binding domain-containing protein, partial [Candidatus Omnitrophota bacterium]